MKVIHFGTIANVPYLLCYGLRRYGIEASVVITHIKQPFLYNKHNNIYQVDLISLEELNDYFYLWKRLLQADILHFHCDVSLAHTFLINLPLQFILQIKLVRHFHGSDIRTLSPKKKKILASISNLLKEKVLVSTFDLMRYWDGAIYLPNPIDPIFFEATSREEEHSIFLPTRLENKTKNVDFAFRAWDILRKINHDIFLKVIFWGEDKNYYFARYKHDQRVIWLNVMSHKEMAFEMKKSSLIWGQLKFGSLGLIELEGMASGKPVLMKFNPPETIRCNPQHPQYKPPVVNVRTPEELAQKTLDLLFDKNTRTKLGQEGKKWAERVHSVKNVTSQLIKIYREIIEK